ncbi:MAG: hypothetical protein FWC38_07280 [Proteobacteria bacterium]|nr:hypothetical protein [Pseudomonadota bacterium]
MLIGNAPIGGGTTAATPVPVNGAWGMAAMILLVAGLGAAGWSRRHRRTLG